MISSISSTNSLSSMLQMRQQMFSKIDTNGDGKHDAAELAQMVANGPRGGPSVENILSQFDTNRDGSISEAEFNAADPGVQSSTGTTSAISTSDFIAQMFGQIDTNSDGAIDTDELKQMAAMGPEGGMSAAELLSQLDANSDGSVSKAEFASQGPWANSQVQGPPPPQTQGESQIKSLFSLFDSNSDGSVSQTELDTALSQITSAMSAYQTTGTSFMSGLMRSALGVALYA